jgi:hypothetical protein
MKTNTYLIRVMNPKTGEIKRVPIQAYDAVIARGILFEMFPGWAIAKKYTVLNGTPVEAMQNEVKRLQRELAEAQARLEEYIKVY